jgi:hypothetical protein
LNNRGFSCRCFHIGPSSSHVFLFWNWRPHIFVVAHLGSLFHTSTLSHFDIHSSTQRGTVGHARARGTDNPMACLSCTRCHMGPRRHRSFITTFVHGIIVSWIGEPPALFWLDNEARSFPLRGSSQRHCLQVRPRRKYNVLDPGAHYSYW